MAQAVQVRKRIDADVTRSSARTAMAVVDRRTSPRLDVVFPIHNDTHRVAKRVLDLTVASLLVVVLSPLLLLVWLTVRCTSRGGAIFAQTRIGKGGRRIRVHKFRTMHVDAERRLERDAALRALHHANGFKLDAHSDPRITPVGRWLRKLSIDELPQLFDVIMGRLSLVGPRPVVPDELARYGDYVCAYLAVRPGVTGLWQVSGRSTIAYPARAEVDFKYVAGWSLRRDVAIMLRTIPAVIACRGSG
jgi:lipopolysaccharide/colanic/teichoic acid biosynthesis glycosyltransferase